MYSDVPDRVISQKKKKFLKSPLEVAWLLLKTLLKSLECRAKTLSVCQSRRYIKTSNESPIADSHAATTKISSGIEDPLSVSFINEKLIKSMPNDRYITSKFNKKAM